MTPKRKPRRELAGKTAVGELARYQEGTVVSREIVNRRSGTITLFAFDRGQGLSEHTAPYDAVVQIVDGAAEITVGGRKHLLSKGEMIIMPARIPHALRAVRRFKMMLTMIRS